MQIALTGRIPFPVALPKAPASMNADLMTDEELQAKLQKSDDDIQAGNVMDAKEFFKHFKK